MLQSSVAKRTKNVFLALGEMRPSLKVSWDDGCIRECSRGFDSFLRRHRQMKRAHFRNTRRADMEQRHLNRKAASNSRNTNGKMPPCR